MAEEKIDIMQKIADATSSVTTGIDDKDIKEWATIYIMGKGYKVPADLTILNAMEYAGYKLVRAVGCRQGFCGACSTVYRRQGEYKLETDLACQTRVEDGMHLVQIPFSPAVKPAYDISKEEYHPNVFLKYFPEIARCVSCNTCTKACPQDLEVMDYIQAALRGDFEEVAEISFDCIQCGLCAIRCPAEIVHYHVAQLGRRMYGRYGCPEPEHLKRRLEELAQGKFDEEMEKLTALDKEELTRLYESRERESEAE